MAKKTTAIAKYDEALAKFATEYADQEAGVGIGQFFSIRGGQLSINDSRLPNDEMAAIIVDAVLENTYYEGDYDPDSPAPPTCYAFGRSEDEMAPNTDDVEEPEADTCSECPHNVYGSSDRGKGKACRNRRRLAIAPAGTLDKQGDLDLHDPEVLQSEPIAYLALPPTSLKPYAAYVKKLNATMKRPPFSVITKVSVVPDNKTQLRVNFELIDVLDEEWLPAVIEMNESQRELIAFAYPKGDSYAEEEAPKPKARNKKTGTKTRIKKPTVNKGSARKPRKY
jgi:hypothetical protein